MARQRRFIDKDVYEESKNRIHHIFDTHDHVNVAFSGGKDSTAVLCLVKEVANERGIDIVDCHHRDEEFNPAPILDNIKYYFDQDWTNMTWYCIPRSSTMFILGMNKEVIKWDPSGNRQWVRDKPSYAETLNNTDKVYGQDDFDKMIADNYKKGKVAIVNGIRADESIVRYRSVVNKITENYIAKSFSPNANLCKPIYDWQMNDIFKYFKDNNIRYSSWYEQQMWSGDALRVASPLISESMKTIEKWALMDPEFYDRLTSVFPEVRAHERYKGTISNKHIYEDYGKDMEGVKQWINDTVDPESSTYKTMMAKWKNLNQLCKSNPERYLVDDKAEWILKHFVNGRVLHGDIYPKTTKEIRQAKKKKKPKINKYRRNK
tara:strand:+ start:390 stop:1517 length:1128 start_codon:yes stop_codon:yes gene_type:complete